MVKDLEWLEEEILKIISRIYGANFGVEKEVSYLFDKLDKPEKPEKPVIPDYVADFIEGSQKEADHWFEAINRLSHNYKRDKENVFKVILDWVNNNPDKYVDAYRYGYTVEKKKTYRFTLNAFHEVDILSYNREGAFKQAEQEWQDTFGGLNTFGGPEFEGEVTE